MKVEFSFRISHLDASGSHDIVTPVKLEFEDMQHVTLTNLKRELEKNSLLLKNEELTAVFLLFISLIIIFFLR